MDSALPFTEALEGFREKAQKRLHRAEDCLQHLELIENDPDACRCLDAALSDLAHDAQRLGLLEVAHFTTSFQQILAPCCQGACLHLDTLRTTAACLRLLAWQLELLDTHTGRLDLDAGEQFVLLGELARAVRSSLAQAWVTGDGAAHDRQQPDLGDKP
ncbi:histidine kinase [Pseudomonas fulva]|uniref:histidine kinase n=1 Tax=Pseudomonas fulva TaxID=47880 RepID=UPI002174DE3B|nr:histidine kinase [Pseudomonas fulva]